MAPPDNIQQGETRSENASSPSPSSSSKSSANAAKKAATALKGFARGRPSSKASTASSASSTAPRNANPFVDSQDASTKRQTSHESSYRPPMPPNHDSTQSSSSKESSGSSSKSGQVVATRRAEAAKGAQNLDLPPVPPIRGRPTGRPSYRHLQAPKNPNFMPAVSSTLASRSQTPLRVTELGRDYTRYPASRAPSTSANSHSVTNPYTPSGGQTPLLSGSTKASPYPSTSNLGIITDSEKADMWLLDDRFGAPFNDGPERFPMYTDEKEDDDDMHTPMPGDDEKYRPTMRNICSPRQLGSLFGFIFLIVGLLIVFIVLPVLGFTGHVSYGYPSEDPYDNKIKLDPARWVTDAKFPLLNNMRTGLIDPATPKSAMKRKTFDGETWDLVFSDEFTKDGRTFYPGDDPYWTAPDLWYGSTQDLEWYDPDAATVADGTLQLTLSQFTNHNLLYRSGMLNSWNQVCMKGGALEIGVSLPGPGGASGLWPGAWTMGNLGRPGYKASTEGLWPYTYNSCDQGITPNQSMTDGTSYLPGQRLPSCTCAGEDHPTPGTGRGAPEIDVFEASADPNLKLGLVTQSFQVAPFDTWYQPDYDFMAIPNFNTTQLNGYCGGPFQQAVSGQTELNNQWYDGIKYQKYGFEYEPGTGSNAYINWFVGDEISFQMNGNAIGPNGNIDYRPVSEEPMSMVLNLGFSTAWTGIHMEELRFPTTMFVDYVRWYQAPGAHTITCDPPGFETTSYIKDHLLAYTNNNLTRWSETGFPWPKHKLNTDNCKTK